MINLQLTSEEAKYFNKEFKINRDDYDFAGKKVAFVTGSAASMWLTKSAYFSEVSAKKGTKPFYDTCSVFLTVAEKEKSGGYDLIVTTWVKLLTNKGKKN